MPRTKELRINASELGCYSQLVMGLNKNPLLADYDLSTIELKVKHNKPQSTLKKNTGELINNLLHYQSANRERIADIEGDFFQVGKVIGQLRQQNILNLG